MLAAFVPILPYLLPNDVELNPSVQSSLTQVFCFRSVEQTFAVHQLIYSLLDCSTFALMASSNEVSWPSAYWALPPLAMNSMLQPAGEICGFDSSLRIYLRSSPIVCAMDTVFIFIRFAFYAYHGYPLRWAASAIVAARSPVAEVPRPDDDVDEDPEPGRFLLLERNAYLLYLALGVGVVTQFVKLMACSGMPWTQVWGCFYILSYLVVEVTYKLGKNQRDAPATNDALQRQEEWIEFWAKVCGVAAILLQLGILASVDMKGIPPNPVLILKWTFICVRFGTHFAVCLIHLPFMALKIDAGKALPDQHWGFLLMSILVPHIILASTQGYRFTQLYFMVSVMISYFSWMLYFFPVTKKYVLLCEAGNRGESENRGRRNVLAFDFFCRILCFSIFWYAVHYDPTGTVKPPWTNYLG